MILMFILMTFALTACQETPAVEEGPTVISYPVDRSLDLKRLNMKIVSSLEDGIGKSPSTGVSMGIRPSSNQGPVAPSVFAILGLIPVSPRLVWMRGGCLQVYLFVRFRRSYHDRLRSETEAVGSKDNFSSRLAYVWVDGILINLRLVESFTPRGGCWGLEIQRCLLRAQQHAMSTGRHFGVKPIRALTVSL